MLADTDAGSVITAAQSGVQWGYRLLLLQVLLMPVLYIVQELTVRLGIFTGADVAQYGTLQSALPFKSKDGTDLKKPPRPALPSASRSVSISAPMLA